MQTVKKYIPIDAKLYNDLKEYCELNGLKTSEFIMSLVKQSFTYEKFGNIPFGTLPTPSIEVEKNVKKETEETIDEATIDVPEEIKGDFNENIHKIVQEAEIKEKPKKIRLN